jgi:excinuclease ABC subunit C
MITFVEGKPSKAHYRRFKIRSKSTPDDYAMMQEVVGRRYQRVKNEKQTLPDLILVDGGKGQLGVAHKVLSDLQLEDIPHIGLAKREEEIFTVDKDDPICLPKTSAALHILQAIRDEAHRFAVSYHKLLRKKRQTKSELDDIPGIGASRKLKLLQYFGSVGELRKATLKDINDIIGDALGTQVFEYLQAHLPSIPADLNPPRVFARKKTTRQK